MTEFKRVVPRLVEADDNTRLFTVAHSIVSTHPPVRGIDAIAVMPGLGEDTRVTTAIRLWESDQNLRSLLVSGTNPSEAVQPQLTLERLQQAPYSLQRLEGVQTQVQAAHTREQTDWLIEQAIEQGVTSMILCVSHWHMPRAYMTLLKSMMNAGIQLPIYPYAIGTSPTQVVPELHETVENLSAGEARRILKYIDMGQIASFQETSEYLDWLWSQDATNS